MLRAFACLILLSISFRLLAQVDELKRTWSPQEWQEHFLKTAGEYVILPQGRTKPLDVQQTSLLNWGNPERQQEQGAMFVWSDGGRPEVIGSIFTYVYADHVYEKHEMQSLAEAPLKATLHDMNVWSPSTGGLNWFAPDPPLTPVMNKRAQSLQMRGIARGFNLRLIDDKNVATQLRPLPQPLVEYSSPERKILTGAVFAYTVATDPEALLVIELVGEPGKAEYRCSFARSRYWKLEATDGSGKLIWTVPHDDMSQNPAGTEEHLHKVYNSFAPPQ